MTLIKKPLAPKPDSDLGYKIFALITVLLVTVVFVVLILASIFKPITHG